MKRKGVGGSGEIRYRHGEMTLAAKRIFEIISDLGMTDYEFSTRYGFSRSSLNGWRNNDIDPGAETIQKFCIVLGISLDDFYKKGVYSDSNDEEKEIDRQLLLMKILCYQIVREGRTVQAVPFMRFIAFEGNNS